MLFPTEAEYIEWFTKAGFTDVKMTRIGPKWYRGVRRHGLIMGCSVTGVKPQARYNYVMIGLTAAMFLGAVLHVCCDALTMDDKQVC
jgi:hypothetical protein